MDNQTKTLIHGSPDVLGFIFQNGHSRTDHVGVQFTEFLQWGPLNYLMGVQFNWVSFSKTDNQTKTSIHGSPDVLGFIFQNGHSRIQHVGVQFTEILQWGPLNYLMGVQFNWASFSKMDN